MHIPLTTTTAAALLLALFPSLPTALPYPFPPPPQPQQQQQQAPFPASYSIPSRHTSTLLARRLLALSTTGVLSTVFPSLHPSSHHLPTPDDDPEALYGPPSSVSHLPIGLPDYIADCESPSSSSSTNGSAQGGSSEGGGGGGDPTILALSVATTFKNAVSGSNVSLSVSWWDEYPESKKMGEDGLWSPASLPRMALEGFLEPISSSSANVTAIEECYLSRHPDTVAWLPGRKDSPHASQWMRLVVREVYWIGGFGDRAFIGWLDVDDWRGITEEGGQGGRGWRDVRLPGEVD